MTNPKLIPIPFADTGSKNDIPESGAAEPQLATMQAGFPVVTQTPISEGGIPPERDDFNGILNLVTANISHLNKGLSYEYDADFAGKIGGYPLNAEIMLNNGEKVKSTIANNANDPNLDMTGWESTKDKNTITTVESTANLANIQNPKDGQVVTALGYKENTHIGGGDFALLQSSALTENLATVFKCAQVGYENYFWVRINFDVLTPEMCGANGTLQDSTDAIERFLKLCGQGYKGLGKPGKIYKTSRFIDVTYSESVNIDFNNATVKPEWDIPAGYGVAGSLRYKHVSGVFTENTSVNVDNLYIDLTSFTPSVSTSVEDRRGVRGLIVEHPEHISINNYKCKGAFYGSGLMLLTYRYAELNGIKLPDCGYKLNPNSDDTGVYDAAGDALYLGTLDGHGLTNITNITAKAQDGFMGRAGVVLEQFANKTLSHVVTMTNAHFDGYHRVVHQEDKGVGKVVWIGGSAKRFSNLIFNLGGSPDVNYLEAISVEIEVNPPFSYGGTSGINNFQGAGDCYLNDCNIKYLADVTERGNKFISGGSLSLGTSVVDHAISTKTHTLKNVSVSSSGGLLYYTSGNRGVNITGGYLNGVAGSLTTIIRSASHRVKISGGCKMTDCSFFCENTLPLGRAKSTISDSEITYTGGTTAVLFSGSFDASYKLSNVVVSSSSARLEMYGDGATRYSIDSSELSNTGVNAINTSATSLNNIVKIRNCEMYYDDNYGATSPIANSFGSLYVVLSNNLLFDATTAQTMLFPADSTTTKSVNNHIVRAGAIT